MRLDRWQHDGRLSFIRELSAVRIWVGWQDLSLICFLKNVSDGEPIKI